MSAIRDLIRKYEPPAKSYGRNFAPRSLSNRKKVKSVIPEPPETIRRLEIDKERGTFTVIEAQVVYKTVRHFSTDLSVTQATRIYEEAGFVVIEKGASS